MGNFKQFNRRDRGQKFGNSDSAKPQMYSATCAKCGDSCQVPFKPSGDRPVYCSKCFEGRRNEGDNFRGTDRRNFGRPNFEHQKIQSSPSFDNTKVLTHNNELLLEQLTGINAKMDLITNALKSKVVETPSPKKKVSSKKASV